MCIRLELARHLANPRSNLFAPWEERIIAKNQSAFIPGRSITDNILLTQELLKGYDCKYGKKDLPSLLQLMRKDLDANGDDSLDCVVRSCFYSLLVQVAQRETRQKRSKRVIFRCFYVGNPVFIPGEVRSLFVVIRSVDLDNVTGESLLESAISVDQLSTKSVNCRSCAGQQTSYSMYCRGKENGVNILKSIDEGPFQMGTFRETLAEGTEGGPHLGLERPRVYSDLQPER
ncbi:hypothetical protein Tco_0299191 [Tanacetum coccineum]